jgi:hypothetical protein
MAPEVVEAPVVPLERVVFSGDRVILDIPKEPKRKKGRSNLSLFNPGPEAKGGYFLVGLRPPRWLYVRIKKQLR